jgi:iron(III) transport system ATP-binding protein
MREEIRRLCKEHGLTTVYVTHDQKEALAVADRVGVMSSGRLLQIGAPAEIYRRPRSRAVAAFVGETNLLAGRVGAADGGEVRVESPVGPLVAARDQTFAPAPGDEVWISIRPECLRLARGVEAAPPTNTLRGRVERVTYLGELAEHRVRVGETTLALFELNARAEPRDEIVASVDPADVVLLPRDEPRGGA